MKLKALTFFVMVLTLSTMASAMTTEQLMKDATSKFLSIGSPACLRLSSRLKIESLKKTSEDNRIVTTGIVATPLGTKLEVRSVDDLVIGIKIVDYGMIQ